MAKRNKEEVPKVKKAVKKVQPVELKELKVGKLTFNHQGAGTMIVKLGEGEEFTILAGMDVEKILDFLKEYQTLKL